MSYNDKQQNNEHLLIWLNAERTHLGQRYKFYTLHQIQTSNLLPLLLLKIQPTFFSSANHCDYDFSQYLLMIEKYLLEVEDLKIKRRYRQELMASQSLSEIVKMILFLVMRSERKQQFVGRILELEDNVQVQLMNELKTIENSLENNMEIKQIFSKIEELQEENEQLLLKLKEVEQQQKNIQTMKKIAKEQNQKLIQIKKKNLQEKSHFMEDLGVVVTKDYHTIFKELQQQREAILVLQKQVQDTNFCLTEANHQMEQKIVEDQQIIEYLTEEIGCYKSSLQELKRQKKKQSLFESSSSNKQNMKYETHQAPYFTDNRMIKSVQAETTICSSKNATMIEQEQVGEILKDYNGDLIAKLQRMYATISSLNLEITDLKNSNQMLTSDNNKKQRKVSRAEREFSEFCLNYEFTISG